LEIRKEKHADGAALRPDDLGSGFASCVASWHCPRMLALYALSMWSGVRELRLACRGPDRVRSTPGALPPQAAFKLGLETVGFIEGQNVAIEYHLPGGHDDGLPTLMAELVQRRVAVIVEDTSPAMAAKTATSTIPIVFVTGTDPVNVGFVASFNHPGGNATGVTFLTATLDAKRLGLLRELLPKRR
jgi:ABC transporter substrate binding protein